MPRSLALVLALATLASTAPAQGIRGVTRRTTTLDRQVPARQFFNAAGLNVTGTGTQTQVPAATPTANLVRPPTSSTLVSRPPVVLPPISQRIARPQGLQAPSAANFKAHPTPRAQPAKPAPTQPHAKP